MVTEPKKTEAEASTAVQEVAETLNVILPRGSTPLAVKIIALLTTAGGLSIVANILSDIVQPNHVSISFYIMRLVVGLAMMSVGYGILKRKGWTVWVYGSISLIALFVNPIMSVLPLCVTAYLYMQKGYFDRDLPRKLWAKCKNSASLHHIFRV